MIEFSEKSGTQTSGAWEATGKIYALEHLIGIFKSRHFYHEGFLRGEICIRFPGLDPLAAQSVGDGIVVWRALAFRGHVMFHFDDLAGAHEPETELAFDRALSLSYDSRVIEQDLDHLVAAADTDFGALDALVESLVLQSFKLTASEVAAMAA
ncbi:MAG: hypothetical protein HY474_00465 [Candidatus Sungbacteria bacterium]|uniref:Uncharacterized protein n=1 Tax=Candidatus Sungiibacteriota bacterium TaxID=2750080 RepID=A0A933DSP8_9BACT|nr:hypothetical protein [Candidatus Sungbacteria bacterium]